MCEKGAAKGQREQLKANTTREKLQGMRRLSLQELSCEKSEPPFPSFYTFLSHASRLCLILQ